MSTILHGWWLDSGWSEIQRDFDPAVDANGTPQYSLVSGVYYPYGNIRTTTWKYIRFDSLTDSPVAPSLPTIDEEGRLRMTHPGGTTLVLPMSGGVWENESPETKTVDVLLQLYEHTVLFKSGRVDEKMGVYSELNTPPAPPPIEEPVVI